MRLSVREQAPQVAPRDDVDAPALALAAEQVEQLGERRVVRDDVDRVAATGQRRRRRPRCCRRGPATTIIGRPDTRQRSTSSLDAVLLDAPRPAPRVVATAAASARRRSARTRGTRGARAAARAGGPAAAPARGRSWRWRTAASPARRGSVPWDAVPMTAPDRRGGTMREDGGRGLVADDRRPFDDAGRGGLEAPMGRLQLSPLAHRVAAAFVFATPASALASLRDTSLPTSVSLSSPRMNASTRWCAMSSWIWSGGLFMK